MKRFAAMMMALVLLFCVTQSLAEAARDEGWTIPETNEMTEEVTAVFTRAMENFVGVNYDPLAFLGENGGVYCFFCRATAVYPDAVPYYTLVYVTEDGVQNVWDIWMEQHAERTEQTGEEETAQPDAAAYTDVQYVLYLGTNDKDTNLPVYSQEECLEKAKDILIRNFGGYTIQEANGGWIDGETEYQEYTLVIYLSDTTLDKVYAAVDEMIQVFNQSSVLIQQNPTRTEYYSAN